jgi:hypothetical protein
MKRKKKSWCRLSVNPSLAILSPSAIFSLPKASHTKKPKAQNTKQKPKAKATLPPSHLVENRVEQRFTGRGMTL